MAIPIVDQLSRAVKNFFMRSVFIKFGAEIIIRDRSESERIFESRFDLNQTTIWRLSVIPFANNIK